MIVSKKWLADYVDLSMPIDELTDRLTLAGLNLESAEPAGGDTAIDLEVTSNRPDCLGHVGIAREVSVLWGTGLKKPDPQPKTGKQHVDKVVGVEITCPELCKRYTARVIRGVKIGPSPKWLEDRLEAIGIARINNVVDITNYVLMECGQPLHAFDLAKLAGGKIIVRTSRANEEFTAIDHKTYKLPAGTCVIADAERSIALGGVMGGAETEVSDSTVDVLIEAADFDPLSIRNTARALRLHSPSSYRFERGVDPEGVDWASRRCCELILELAGGELLEGVAVAGPTPTPPSEIKLRFPQLKRVLGIDVSPEEVGQILKALGCTETHTCGHCIKVIPPTWRADLIREIDLIEEVARIHGYDKIPEDVGVRMVPSSRTRQDVVLDRVRQVLTAAGFDEAMTLSTVDPEWVETFRPWTMAEPLVTSTPVLRRANSLRQSVVPSLLHCRRTNETFSNPVIEQFEIAKVYLPQGKDLPEEKRVLALSSGRGFLHLKGVIEAIVQTLMPGTRVEVERAEFGLLAPGHAATLRLNDQVLGVIGDVAQAGLDRFDLRSPATVAEIDIAPLIDGARLIPRARPLVNYQSVTQDLNVVFSEQVAWGEVERIVVDTVGDLLERLEFQEVYRDEQRLGPAKKSLLWSMTLRSKSGTLAGEQVDALRDKLVADLAQQLGGELRT